MMKSAFDADERPAALDEPVVPRVGGAAGSPTPHNLPGRTEPFWETWGTEWYVQCRCGTLNRVSLLTRCMSCGQTLPKHAVILRCLRYNVVMLTLSSVILLSCLAVLLQYV